MINRPQWETDPWEITPGVDDNYAEFDSSQVSLSDPPSPTKETAGEGANTAGNHLEGGFLGMIRDIGRSLGSLFGGGTPQDLDPTKYEQIFIAAGQIRDSIAVEMQKSLDVAKAALEQAESLISDNETINGKLAEVTESIRLTVLDLTAAKATVEQNVSELSSLNSKLQTEISRSDAQASEITKLSGDLGTQTTKVSELTSDLSSLSSQLQAEVEAGKTQDDKIAALTADIKAVTDDFTASVNAAVDANAKVAKAAADASKAISDLNALAPQVSNALATAQASASDAKTANDLANKAITDMVAVSTDAKNAVSTATTASNNANTALSTLYATPQVAQSAVPLIAGTTTPVWTTMMDARSTTDVPSGVHEAWPITGKQWRSPSGVSPHQMVSINPDSTYKFTVWLKASKAGARVALMVSDQNKVSGVVLSGSVFGGSGNLINSTTDLPTAWMRYETLVTFKSHVRFIYLSAISTNSSTVTDATVSIADLQLVPHTANRQDLEKTISDAQKALADSAKSLTDSAKAIADSAKATADAGSAMSKANALEPVVTKAQQDSASAITKADSAVSAATTATTAANTATTKANEAFTKADGAFNTASTAITSAGTALSTAQTNTDLIYRGAQVSQSAVPLIAGTSIPVWTTSPALTKITTDTPNSTIPAAYQSVAKQDYGGLTGPASNTFVGVDPSLEYEVSVWVKASKAGSRMIIGVSKLTEDGTEMAGAVTSGSIGGGNYQLMNGTFDLPTTWTKYTTRVRWHGIARAIKINSIRVNQAGGTVTDAVQFIADLQIKPVVPSQAQVDDAQNKAISAQSDATKALSQIVTVQGEALVTNQLATEANTKAIAAGQDATNALNKIVSAQGEIQKLQGDAITTLQVAQKAQQDATKGIQDALTATNKATEANTQAIAALTTVGNQVQNTQDIVTYVAGTRTPAWTTLMEARTTTDLPPATYVDPVTKATVNTGITEAWTESRQGSRTIPANTPASGWSAIDHRIEYRVAFWIKADKPNSKASIAFMNQTGSMNCVESGTVGATNWLLLGMSNFVVPTEWTRIETVIKFRSNCQQVRINAIEANHPVGTERNAKLFLAGLTVTPNMPSQAQVDAVQNKAIEALNETATYLQKNAELNTKVDTYQTAASTANTNAITALNTAMGTVFGGQNLIPFKAGTTIPAWAAVAYQQNSKITAVTTDTPNPSIPTAYTGVGPVNSTVPTTDGFGTYTAVDPNIEYKFSVWVKASKAGSRMVITTNYRTADTEQNLRNGVASGTIGGTGFFLNSLFEIPTTWTKLETVIKFNPDVRFIRIESVRFNQSGGTTNDGQQWIADMQLTPNMPSVQSVLEALQAGQNADLKARNAQTAINTEQGRINTLNTALWGEQGEFNKINLEFQSKQTAINDANNKAKEAQDALNALNTLLWGDQTTFNQTQLESWQTQGALNATTKAALDAQEKYNEVNNELWEQQQVVNDLNTAFQNNQPIIDRAQNDATSALAQALKTSMLVNGGTFYIHQQAPQWPNRYSYTPSIKGAKNNAMTWVIPFTEYKGDLRGIDRNYVNLDGGMTNNWIPSGGVNIKSPGEWEVTMQATVDGGIGARHYSIYLCRGEDHKVAMDSFSTWLTGSNRQSLNLSARFVVPASWKTESGVYATILCACDEGTGASVYPGPRYTALNITQKSNTELNFMTSTPNMLA